MKTIYLYHLTQNGRVRYVGVTTQLDIRKSFWKRTKPPHIFEIVDTFTNKKEAGIAEQYHIAGYKTNKTGWNRSIGGEKLLTGDKHPRYIDGRTSDWKAYQKVYNEEYRNKPEVKAKRKEYFQRLEVKAKKKEYDTRPENIAKVKEYTQRPENIARRKERRNTPEQRAKATEYQRAYRARKKQLKL